MNKLKKMFYLVERPKLLVRLLSLGFNGYLYETGWINSYLEQSPVNNKSKPLPWVTLPFIDFIKERLDKDIVVFEYGSGNSTLFLADYVKQVFSVEHDQKWFDIVTSKAQSNVELYYCNLEYNSRYCRFAETLDLKFNLIIVDGRDRVNCVLNSLEALTQDGCIVIDDSERKYYRKAIDFLEKNKFKRIDFWGIAPGLSEKKCTSVFYRNDNCLKI